MMQSREPTVADLMTEAVVLLEPDALVGTVLDRSRREGIHHFPIVEGNTLIGLVCTCDLQEARRDTAVRQLVPREVVSVPPETLASSAAKLMTAQAVGSVVVVGSDGVCGIVTREDLAKANSELALLLEQGHCTACQSLQHLHRRPDGTFLCLSCASRARQDDWFDIGAGD